MLKRLMKKDEGFTLAELLIVVAIIAVLTAIAIPVFTTQLEKSREATDMSNVRAAYAEVMANYLANGAKTATSGSAKTTAKVTPRQTKTGWQNPGNGKLFVRVNGEEKSINFSAKTTGSWTVSIAPSNSKLVTVS